MAAALYQIRAEQLAMILQHLGRSEGAEFTRAGRTQVAANLGVNDPRRWMEMQMPSQGYLTKMVMDMLDPAWPYMEGCLSTVCGGIHQFIRIDHTFKTPS